MRVIFERSRKGGGSRAQVPVPASEAPEIPVRYLRGPSPGLPEVSELEAVRHYTRLSQLNFSNDISAEPRHENAERINHTPALKPLLDIFHEDPAQLLQTRLLDPAGTDRLLNAFVVPASAWVSTDDNLFLEYSTPKGNVLDGTASFESNKQFLLTHSRKNPGSLAAHLGAPGTRSE